MCLLIEKSIALIIPDFGFGGEEKRVVFFANSYLNYYKKVYLISPDGESSKLLDSRVIHYKITVRNYFNTYKILHFLYINKVNILQGHKRVVLPYLKMAELLLNVNCNFNYDNIYPSYNTICSLLSPKNIIYLSDVLKNYYKSYYKGHNNFTINMGGDFYNILHFSQIQNIKEELHIKDKFILLSLGRLSVQKNHNLLIRAIKSLGDINIVCLIVGSGPLESELKSLVDTFCLNSKVIFLGHRNDIEDLLNISDALIQSSFFEGFPNVFIEATSVGVPIISTNVGSSSTLVQKCGILVESNNQIELADAIMEMYSNADYYKNEASKLKISTFFNQFHKSEMLLNYINYYKSFE